MKTTHASSVCSSSCSCSISVSASAGFSSVSVWMTIVKKTKPELIVPYTVHLLIESSNSGLTVALSPGPTQILSRSRGEKSGFLHGCEIKSGLGLGTRLVFRCVKLVDSFSNHKLAPEWKWDVLWASWVDSGGVRGVQMHPPFGGE